MSNINGLIPDLRLLFNIEHPSFEDCYAHGYECALAEIREEDNPYHSGSKESEYWVEGWWAGFYGEKPLHQFESDADSQEVLDESKAANDYFYHENLGAFLAKFFEITSMLAVSAAVGYQLVDLVA